MRPRPERAREAAKAAPRVGSLEAVLTKSIVRAVLGRQRVVYGTDDRKGLYQVKNKSVLSLAQSVAALVQAFDLTNSAE